VRRGPLIAGLVLLVAALAAASLIVGKTWVPLDAWLAPADDGQRLILTELRLPRALLGIVVGFSLGLSGAVLQGYLRNPLADPGLLGVSAAAALGAVLSIHLGIAASGPWTLPTMAMLGAVAAVLLLVALAGEAGSVITFVLAGVMVNAFAGALTSLAISLSDDPFATAEIVTWLMGALTDRSMADLAFALPFVIGGALMLLTTARSLDALTLGEAGAASLGVRLGRLRLVIALGVGAAVGASVAVTGVIGFVGLVVPHLLRPLAGHRPGGLLLPSALGGAALVLAADVLVRLSPGAQELKLGIAMALLGAPFFLALLLRLRRTLV
jgi:iron complex transport system permease protein